MGKLNFEFPPYPSLDDAVLAYAIDLANGDVDEQREVIDVEYEDLSNTDDGLETRTDD